MESEATRRKIFDEIHAQFETKLREAREQKSQAEAELESVSERYRAERRRLNSEIDRLEGALADAKQAQKQSHDSRNVRSEQDPAEATRLQESSEDKIRQAGLAWEAERQKLRGEIARLEKAVAEMLERSNNPLRASMIVKEELQAKLEEAYSANRQIAEELQNTRIAFGEEKLRMTGEMVRLRRAAAQGKVRGKSDDDDRIEELEKRIAEVLQNRDTLEQELRAARVSGESHRQNHTTLAVAAGTADTQAMLSEVARVEQTISEIASLVQDPATELSVVIRKNVERAELSAYLKGIRFSLGKVQ